MRSSRPVRARTWTGSGNNQINFKRRISGAWRTTVTTGQTSFAAPALAYFNGRYYAAWSGNRNNQLNVMSSANGTKFDSQVILTQTTYSDPALAAGANQLHVAWRGVGNDQLNVLSSTDGSTFGNYVTLSQTTDVRPALNYLGNQLVLAWQGTGNAQITTIVSTDGGRTFKNLVTSGQTCVGGPAVAPGVIVWTSTTSQGNLNIATLSQ